MIFLAILFLLIAAVHATPAIEFPLNSQLPPIAQVSNPFHFVFSGNTFSSVESDAIIYSISNYPRWLHLDSRNRALYGTPRLDDVGMVTFKLIGTDATGSTNMPVTIIVTTNPGTVLNEFASPLLAEDGELSDIASFSVHPSQLFSFSVDPDTFISPRENTMFYATSTDNAPLPSWVTFDSATLEFSGKAPPASQIFNFSVIAADIEDYRSATSALKIAVSPHILSFKKVLLDFNATIGEHFNTSNLRDTLMIDGKPLEDDYLTSVNADFPNWLTLDEDTLLLSGTPPKSAKTDTAIISVTDIYGNIANITITITIRLQRGRPLFSEKVGGSYYIVAGEDFSYTFDESFLAGKSVHMDVDAKDSFPWMEYDAGGRTLHGRVPDEMETKIITVPLLASNGQKNETIPFTIRVYNNNKPSSCASSTSSSVTPCLSSSSTFTPESVVVGTDKKEYIIPIAVIIPIFILGAGLILAYSRRNKSWAAICKRKKNKKSGQEITASEMEKTAIQPATELNKEVDTSSPFSVAVASTRPTSGSVSPTSNPPNPLARRQNANRDDENRSSVSMFSQIFSRPVSKYGAAVTSEQNPGHNTGEPHGAALKSATFARKRGSFNPHWPRERSLSSETTDFPPTPNPQAICPHGRKMSNAGHGSTGSISSEYDAANRSWQTTQTSLQSESSLGNLTSRFPLPPALRVPTSSDTRIPGRPERPDRESTSTVLLASPRRFSESNNRSMSENQEPGAGFTVSPLFSGRPTTSGSLVKSNTESLRSNSWTTTNNSLSTYPGNNNNLHDYPQQPLRSPSFGSVFNVGFGLRRPSAEHSIQHSRTRSQRSQDSGRSSQYGWMTTGRLGSYGSITGDIEEEPGSSGDRRWYGVPPLHPPPVPPPPPPLPLQQQPQPKTRKYSYPILLSNNTHASVRHDNIGPSNSNDPTVSSSAQNTSTRQACESSTATRGTDEGSPQPSGHGKDRWRLGETQESRYVNIRNDSFGAERDGLGKGPSSG